jgi:Protein of unknown function (DUF1570)
MADAGSRVPLTKGRATGMQSLITDTTRCLAAGLALAAVCLSGCQSLPKTTGVLPDRQRLVREHLTIHADFPVPRRHRLVEELILRRNDLEQAIGLSLGDEPVHVYLYSDHEAFEERLCAIQPALAGRRAVFEETDTELRVLACWGDRIAEDLRHEVTHGFLHACVPNIPLWLDEGLAEHFETPRGTNEVHRTHVELLARSFRERSWTPSLERLESIRQSADMKQLDYAEAWLWVHFLLRHSTGSRELLTTCLRQLQADGRCQPFGAALSEQLPDADLLLLEHLRQLAGEL